MNVGITSDTPNGFKEAIEQREYQKHLRKEYLSKKYGKERGGVVFEAEEVQMHRRTA